VRSCKLIEKQTIEKGDAQRINVNFERIVVIIFREILSFANFNQLRRKIVRNST